MKKLFKEQNISINQLQKELGLSGMKLYRYTNKECKLENMPTSLILQLSNYFKIEPNKLYKKMMEYRKEMK